jgi:hypothetical protein
VCCAASAVCAFTVGACCRPFALLCSITSTGAAPWTWWQVRGQGSKVVTVPRQCASLLRNMCSSACLFLSSPITSDGSQALCGAWCACTAVILATRTVPWLVAAALSKLADPCLKHKNVLWYQRVSDDEHVL